MSQCPVCGNEAPCDVVRDMDACDVDCRRCGKYRIDGLLRTSINTDGAATFKECLYWLVSAALRVKSEHGCRTALSFDSLPGLVAQARRPTDLLDQLDLVVDYVGRREWDLRRDNSSPTYVTFNPWFDCSIAFSQPSQCASVLETLREQGHLKVFEGSQPVSRVDDQGSFLNTDYRVQLTTPKGWERYREVRTRERQLPDQAFVAMWFDDSLRPAWTDAMEPALTNARYKPLRIDAKESVGKICDEIMVEIRRSGLVVADFTGHRGGVYFEAGFAMGLGVPVIWTCREDDAHKLHFDIRQYNHILWKDLADLRERLQKRVEALFPLGV